MHADPPSLATTGIRALDDALGGLLWGDNVVFELEPATDVHPFYEAIAGETRYTSRLIVRFGDEPAFAGFDVLDAAGRDPSAVRDELLARVRAAGPCGLVLVDDIARAVDAWGEDEGWRFFSRTCPNLLRLGAIAYWTIGAEQRVQALRDRVNRLTQVVIGVEPERLTVVKAEARPPGVVGNVVRYGDADGTLTVEEGAPAVRLAVGLSALRAQRGMTQSELARIVGVTPSAISQAERGQRGLSLHTLVEICDRLGVSLDGLVRGHADPGYDLRRRLLPHHGDASREALLDAPGAPFRLYEFRLDPGAIGSPPQGTKGTELVAIGQGLVRLEITSGAAPVLREGEAVVMTTHAVREWENLGEDEALGFWLALS